MNEFFRGRFRASGMFGYVSVLLVVVQSSCPLHKVGACKPLGLCCFLLNIQPEPRASERKSIELGSGTEFTEVIETLSSTPSTLKLLTLRSENISREDELLAVN